MSYSQNNPTTLPVTLAIAGQDPTGGAGIQADIEAIISMGCHACSVPTALTIQDTTGVMGFAAVEPDLVIQMTRALLEDISVATIKIGMLGSTENVEAIHSILIDYPEIPVVLDPVLASGGGNPLADTELQEAMRELLFPLVTLLTPNSPEARQLAPDSDNLNACAMSLLDHGCRNVLITGTHEQTGKVINTLYQGNGEAASFEWPRLPDSYHGSGCTLSSAIAALLAHGKDLTSAVTEGQEFTWHSLKEGYQLGMGQLIPNRLFWAGWDEGKSD